VVRALDEALPTDSGTVDRTLEPRYQIEKGIDSRAALLYREAFDYLTACTNRMRSGEPLDLAAAFDIASRLVDCLESGKDLLILATDRASGYSWRQHSVNVAILAAQTGMTMNLAVETVLKIAIAGLVHDVGTLKLPSRLTLVSTDLSRKDREEIHRRPAYSAALLSDDPSFSWLPAIVARVYERENGKGYPKGLSGADIPIESKVIGVVDVFEACIHARPQRPPLTGHTALEVLTAETNRFSERVTKAMIRAFSVYPYNERVVLNTGELCQVVDVNSNSPMRPVVRIIEPIEGREHRQDQVLDLSISPHLWIAKAVTMPRDGAGD
jgi:HD-GYP domain-containing protein (c-di-GMP phosphodiesterase class II)